uniref:Fibronectin type-III domain-containing protein n=1 Tax=Steinernema glaseri TaxID=37863 RepID=A0A1I7YQB5_9BILA
MPHRRRSLNYTTIYPGKAPLLPPSEGDMTFYAISSPDGLVNVSTRGLTLKNMHHFTHYSISVRACQDVTENAARCSQAQVVKVKTRAIPEKDLIDVSTVRVEVNNSTGNMERTVSWEHPKDPNGAVFAYKVWMGLVGENTASQLCIPKDKFDQEGGLKVTLNAYGTYFIAVQTVSMFQLSASAVHGEVFSIRAEPLALWVWILIVASVLIFIAASVSIFFYYNQFLNKRMQKYWRQTVSANPDYISQLETYQPDEWEIPREALKIYEEIGRGTFGKPDEWEIPREALKIYEEIGRGTFGKVRHD